MIVLIVNLFLNFYLIHPVHVSITNMDYVPEKNRIDLSFKLYKNDFQLLFIHLKQLNIDFNKDEEIQKFRNEIDHYFLNHFKISNCVANDLSFIETKSDEESIWFYYTIQLANNETKSIEITNTILLDLYFDQKNMLIVHYNNQEKGYLFNLKQTKQLISLDDF